MNFYETGFGGKRTGRMLVAEDAVVATVEHDAHNAEGEIERLQAKVESLTQLVGRLLGELKTLRPDQVESVLSYRFEVEG
jgi:chromosome segregation ATPase